MARLYPMSFTLCHEDGKMPQIGTKFSAGADICSREDLVIPAGKFALVKTGISTVIDYGYYGQLLGRSGLAMRHGIAVLGGVIDRDYKGEVCVNMLNASDQPFEVKKGDRICQIVCIKIGKIKGSMIKKTKRGKQGFGSTGTN